MSEGIPHTHSKDPYEKKIGLMAAILAVLLSIFTISAHRAHTETIVLQNESNDQWARYQAKRIREYQLEMNMDMLNVLAPNTHPQLTKILTAYKNKQASYQKDLEEIKQTAEIKTHESITLQKKALYYDFAEGVLEIALVLSSLYFISHKKLFPGLGLFFAVAGIIIGVLGFLI